MSTAIPPAQAKRKAAPRMAREARREQILESTTRLIAEEGYDAVSMASVARAAGVTRPVVYSIFPTLDDLMLALLERQGSRVFGQIATNLQSASPGDDPLELWSRNLGAFLHAVENDPDTWRLVLLPPPSTPAVIRQRFLEIRGQLVRAIGGLIDWGLRARGLTGDFDIELHSMFALSVFEQSGQLLLTDPERFTIERLVRFSRTFFEFSSAPREQ